jgi:hypothetical protein
MKKKLFITFIASVLLFLLTCWSATYTIYAAGWVETISFFALTYFLLEKYNKPGTFGTPYVIAIILGRIVLELPVRISDFSGSFFSMFVPIIVVASILLGALCNKEKQTTVYILSLIIIILLNTAVHEKWLQLFHNT